MTKVRVLDYYEGNVYNSDQSGFNKEMHSGRSLAFKGQQHVFEAAQSVNALTHLYTIMPTISMNGELQPPLYIVLQETKGEFGPRVKETMYKASNILVDATRSGKMGKKEILNWLQSVFFPNSCDKSALLIDSWPTINDSAAINQVKPDSKSLDVYKKPAKTTGIAQALDVFVFRQWKALFRNILDRIVLKQSDYALFQRDHILKLQSFIRKLSWYKRGYISNRPSRFENPSQFFVLGQDKSCKTLGCGDPSFG